MRFSDALAGPGLGAIAEIKRRSPSLGDIRPDADPARIAREYAAAGAAAVSVLVDERFGGTWDDLRAARASTGVPLLAKGFFSTEEHLRTAKEAGADAVLLLLRDLDDDQVRALTRLAGELGLDTLVEAHDADELERAVIVGAPVIGVNARDLSTFEIDRDTQLALVARIPADRIAIAESGIRTRAQGAAAELAGADAILVGSTLMQAPDPAAKLRELLSAPAGQGLRPHARGGRRRRGRGGRRPGRLRPRAGEPPGGEGRPTGSGRAARGRGLGRRGGHERRAGRPGARARGGPDPRPQRRAPARAASRSRACSTCRGRRRIRATGTAPPPSRDA